MKNKLFRLLALLLAFVMLMGTFGCGSSSDDDSSGNPGIDSPVDPDDSGDNPGAPDYSGDSITVPDVKTDDFVNIKLDADGNPFTGVDAEDGLLYFNGELFSGIYSDNKLYADGALVSGFVAGKLYVSGMLFSGQYTDNLYYKDGIIIEDGYITEDGKLYIITSGTKSEFTGEYDSKHYVNGLLKNAIETEGGKLYEYVDGVKGLLSGEYENKMYADGVLLTGVYENKYYKDGVLFSQGTVVVDNKAYSVLNGVMTVFNGMFDDLYYQDGVLYTGTALYNSKAYQVTDGVMSLLTGTHASRYYVDGQLLTGINANDNNKFYLNGEVCNEAYQGILYQDGIKASGTINNLFYQNGTPYTGEYEGTFYQNGVVTELTVDGTGNPVNGFHTDGKLYSAGLLYTGKYSEDSLYYVNGVKLTEGNVFDNEKLYSVANGVMTLFNGEYENKYYVAGDTFTGVMEIEDKFYNVNAGVKGELFSGEDNGKLYEAGELFSGVNLSNNKLYKDGEVFSGTHTDGKVYNQGVLADGLYDDKIYRAGELFTGKYTDNKYYKDGVLLATGMIFYENVLYSVTAGVMTAYTGDYEDGKYYSNGTLFTGVKELEGKLYQISSGIKSLFSGIHDSKLYKDGALFSGIHTDDKLYKDGVVFSGIHTDNKLYKDGALFSGAHTDGKVYNQGELADGLYDGDGKVYAQGVLFTGVYENKYYENGVVLSSGTVKVGETVYSVSSGTMTLFNGTYENKYYKEGVLFTGADFVGGVLYVFTAGVQGATFNGTHNGQEYENGVLVSGGGSTEITTVTFAYFADEEEAAVVQSAIDWYNANDGVRDGIKIEGQAKPGNSYVDYIERLDGAATGPDVFLVGDRYIKRWSSRMPLLENLQPYIDNDPTIDMSNMWASAVWRNKYDPVNNTSNNDDDMYALPRDLSPTSIYYNQTVFERHGIACISVDEEDIDAFNNGAPDRNGKTKSDYGLDGVKILPKGFYRDNPYDREYGIGLEGGWVAPNYKTNGTINEVIYFNNRIAMSWDEVEDLGMIFTRKYNSQLSDADTKWGYYTEWWFSYGWGVGGDCLEDTTGNGDWTFTLGDKTKKKLLYNADGSYATDDMGKAIFVKESEWSSYPLSAGQYLGKELPTQYDAFKRFYDLGRPIEYGGLEIAMRQRADISTSSADTFFINGDVAMLVQPSTAISNFRKTIGNKFTWDIAPLPIYKEYEDMYSTTSAKVVNQGIQIGHSAETSVGVWTGSKNKDAAYKVVKYFSTGHAQTLQAQAGYFLPNDIDLAKTTYVNANATPKNIQILTEIATLQQPADWWYMTDNKWIDVWATPLNTEYRESAKTVDEFFSAYTDAANAELAKYKN